MVMVVSATAGSAWSLFLFMTGLITLLALVETEVTADWLGFCTTTTSLATLTGYLESHKTLVGKLK